MVAALMFSASMLTLTWAASLCSPDSPHSVCRAASRADWWAVAITAALGLMLIRLIRLQLLARAPGPIEVRPVDDGGVSTLVERRRTPEVAASPERVLHRLSVDFRSFLSSPRLYATTPVPGDQETERIIDVMKTAQPGERLAALAAAWTYFWPSRAYIISATLRTRDMEPRFGATATVRRLPHPPVDLETHWSSSHTQALERAAFAVTSYLLPNTMAGRRAPWSQWWRGRRPIPMELVRHYQRAKIMVNEHRYDEALALYHSALLHDADNIHLRYELGQVLERLQLHPDALMQYVELTDRIFPIIRGPKRPNDRRRRTRSQRWRNRHLSPDTDPFLIRYRYLVCLGNARKLTRDLLDPPWPGPGRRRSKKYKRPWRETELNDLRRRLGRHLDQGIGFGEYVAGVSGLTLEKALTEPPTKVQEIVKCALAATPTKTATSPSVLAIDAVLIDEATAVQWICAAVEEHLLKLAAIEGNLIRQDYPARFTLLRQWLQRTTPALSATGLAIVRELNNLRKSTFVDSLPSELRAAVQPVPSKRKATTNLRVREMQEQLKECSYESTSTRWLDHYLVACFWAQPLLEDRNASGDHLPFAVQAVTALELALRHGDAVEFPLSKRYWLSAGDPDLAGLRHYGCFRAWLGRVYLNPTPEAADAHAYELLQYIRNGLLRVSRQQEEVWRGRAQLVRHQPQRYTDLEVWFRDERRSWEAAVRLGLFHRQWFTRANVLEYLRDFAEQHHLDPTAPAFPDQTRDDARTGAKAAGKRVKGMTAILKFMGHDLGKLAAIDRRLPPLEEQRNNDLVVITKTRYWLRFLEGCSRGEDPVGCTAEDLEAQCIQRAQVWAALRHWVTTPARRDASIFLAAVQRLDLPPR